MTDRIEIKRDPETGEVLSPCCGVRLLGSTVELEDEVIPFSLMCSALADVLSLLAVP